MTQAEKAKAYDEAIERAKKWYNAPNIDKMPTYGNRVIEEIFPELKESEDEKIRKILIDIFNVGAHIGGQTNGVPDKDILAWLEKQGEQKVGCTTLVETITIPESKIVVNENKEWNEEDNKWIESLIQTFEDEYLEGFNQLKSYGVINWLKSLKERINGKQ